MYVCMYVCMYLCMYLCIYALVYECKYVCINTIEVAPFPYQEAKQVEALDVKA